MRRRSGFGIFELVTGALLILLGVFTAVKPALALTTLVYIYGIAAIVMGAADIVIYIRVERFTGFGPVLSMVMGILSVMAGVMLLVYPGAGLLTLSVIFPIWFIAHCVSRLAHIDHIRMISGAGMYWFTLIVNILGIIVGFVMMLRPLLTLAAAGYAAGFYLLLLGVECVAVGLSELGRRR